MHYSFPNISNLTQIKAAINGDPSFIVADRGDHIVVNYVVAGNDTFPDVTDVYTAARRECRGLIFDKETEHLIRRPLHKFFNVGERTETLPANIDWTRSHIVLEKLDGSMIVPYRVRSGDVIWGTKMGLTDVAKQVEAYVAEHPSYSLLEERSYLAGLDIIFEWCSRKNRIVIDHPRDELILIAARDRRTGVYYSYSAMKALVNSYDIPVVKAFDSITDIDEFIEHTRGLQDTEGYVVRFDDGMMVKVKCDWYVQIHRAKDAITNERLIIQMILDGNLDDVKGFLPQDDLERVNRFEMQFFDHLVDNCEDLLSTAEEAVRLSCGDRKIFALGYGQSLRPSIRGMVFSIFDDPTQEKAYETFGKTLRKHLNQNIRYDEFKAEFWPDFVYHSEQQEQTDD